MSRLPVFRRISNEDSSTNTDSDYSSGTPPTLRRAVQQEREQLRQEIAQLERQQQRHQARQLHHPVQVQQPWHRMSGRQTARPTYSLPPPPAPPPPPIVISPRGLVTPALRQIPSARVLSTQLHAFVAPARVGAGGPLGVEIVLAGQAQIYLSGYGMIEFNISEQMLMPVYIQPIPATHFRAE